MKFLENILSIEHSPFMKGWYMAHNNISLWIAKFAPTLQQTQPGD